MTCKQYLIIEDERHLAELVAYRLEQAGYRCLAANDGVLGLEMARRHLPDLVLLDLMLPAMLGTEGHFTKMGKAGEMIKTVRGFGYKLEAC